MSTRNSNSRGYPGEDDMANQWGAKLVEIFSCLSVTRIMFDSLIRTNIPGFRLLAVPDSGTGANQLAISEATSGNTDLCLFAMGSYVGGLGVLEDLSSTATISNWQLSLVKAPDHCSDKVRAQTVAFPYHIPHDGLDDEQLCVIEDSCLEALSIKLTCAKLQGKPFQALLLEYILSGTGGELTTRFLEKLAVILTRFNVTVIADEIMTGGRVGPTMIQTTRMPKAFIHCTKFVTLGKTFGCGLVLEKATKTVEFSLRGTTTEIEVGEAYAAFAMICKFLDDKETNVIERKRNRVVQAMGLAKEPNKVWGHGLLMFSSKSRAGPGTNLKCRLLPQMDMDPKKKLVLGCKDTAWNRVSVNSHLLESVDAWLKHGKEHYSETMVSPYTVEIAKYLTQFPNTAIIYHAEMVKSMEKRGVDPDALVAEYRATKKRRLKGSQAARSTAKHGTLVFESLNEASSASQGFITCTAKNHARRQAYPVNFNGDSS